MKFKCLSKYLKVYLGSPRCQAVPRVTHVHKFLKFCIRAASDLGPALAHSAPQSFPLGTVLPVPATGCDSRFGRFSSKLGSFSEPSKSARAAPSRKDMGTGAGRFIIEIRGNGKTKKPTQHQNSCHGSRGRSRRRPGRHRMGYHRGVGRGRSVRCRRRP